MEEICSHVEWGAANVEPFTSIQDYKNVMQTRLEQAQVWQANATALLASRVSAQKVANMIKEGRTLCCRVPELETLEHRAQVFSQISEALHKRHKEESLQSMLSQAQEINADEKFLEGIETRLSESSALKSRIAEALSESRPI